VKELSEVRKDREYYGTTRAVGSRVVRFLDVPAIIVSNPVHGALEDLKVLVYREAYLDVLCEVRDIRNTIEEIREGDPSLITLDELVDRLESLFETLSSLPLPKEIYKRVMEMPVALRDHRQVLMWYRASSLLRRNLPRVKSGINPKET